MVLILLYPVPTRIVTMCSKFILVLVAMLLEIEKISKMYSESHCLPFNNE